MRTFRIYFLRNLHTYHTAVNYCHVVHCIPSTYVSYDWKFQPSDHLCPIPPTHPPPLVTTNLISLSMSFVCSDFLVLFFFRFHI